MPSETALRDIARCIETVQELAHLYDVSDGQARAYNHDHDLGLGDFPDAYGRPGRKRARPASRQTITEGGEL